jgi:transposase
VFAKKRARNLLFLSSFTACKYNPGCKQLFDRITGAGKSKKLALIAVGNKLIKQAFCFGKGRSIFQPGICESKKLIFKKR